MNLLMVNVRKLGMINIKVYESFDKRRKIYETLPSIIDH